VAIPHTIQFVFLEGVFRDPTDEEETDLWPWALTYHVRIDANTGGEIDPAKLELLATAKMNNVGSGGLFTGMGSGMVCTRRGAVNLLTETAVEIVEDVQMQIAPNQAICAPQTSLFILGRTDSLSHQTRKWMPGIQRSFLQDDVPKWKLTGFPPSANLRQWCAQQLQEQNYFGVGLGEDIVWDPVNETVRRIREIVVQEWPRTIRARVNSAKPEWVEVG